MTQQERLEKGIGKGLTKGWSWCGNGFHNFMYKGVEGAGAWIYFTAGYQKLTAEVATEDEYGIANEEKKFEGENALIECVSWVAERLIELHRIVSKRVAPYVEGYTEYRKALRGEKRNGA